MLPYAPEHELCVTHGPAGPFESAANGVAWCVEPTSGRTVKVAWTTLTLDCADGEELATFWSLLLGWEIVARDGAGWAQLRDPDGGIGLNIQADVSYERPLWPEKVGHQAKMMHMEVLVDDLGTAVARVLALGGAEAQHQPPDRDQHGLRTMLDPAGHPFCLFVDGE